MVVLRRSLTLVLLGVVGWPSVARAQELKADDFDLVMVVELMSSSGRGSAANLAALEQLINDPATGINNVDSDGDGLVDYVQCRDEPILRYAPDARTVTCEALSLSGQKSGAERLVVIDVVQYRDRVIVSGIFSRPVRGPLVNGYTFEVVRDANYSNHYFLTWLFDTRPRHRPVYGRRGPYRYRVNDQSFYRPWQKRSDAALERRRHEFRERLRRPPVAPIPPNI